MLCKCEMSFTTDLISISTEVEWSRLMMQLRVTKWKGEEEGRRNRPTDTYTRCISGQLDTLHYGACVYYDGFGSNRMRRVVEKTKEGREGGRGTGVCGNLLRSLFTRRPTDRPTEREKETVTPNAQSNCNHFIFLFHPYSDYLDRMCETL